VKKEKEKKRKKKEKKTRRPLMEKMKNSALSNRFPNPIPIAHRPADKPHAVQCKRWKKKNSRQVGRQASKTNKQE